jgi:protein ImuA
MGGLALVSGEGGLARSDAVRALRDRIREIEGERVGVVATPCGLPEIDRLLGGLPSPGLLELHGPPGGGRAGVALGLAAALTQRERLVAWVDAGEQLYPPAAAARGVVLPRLLVVRPAPDRVTWAAEQLLRSGCFSLVVISEPRLRGQEGYRWARAVEAGGCTGVVLVEHPSRALPATQRLAVGQGRISVVRDRVGASTGREVVLSPGPPSVDPWAEPVLPWAEAS